MSVFVVRAFVQMRDLLGSTKILARQLAALEKKLTARLDVHESVIVDVLRRVMEILDPPPLPPEPPRRRIGFHVEPDDKPETRQRKRRELCNRRDMIATMKADPTKALQPGRRHGLHPAECAPPESRGEGAKEKINMKLLNQTCLVILLALPIAANAREQSAPPIQVNVGDVTDNRTTSAFNSECKVELKFTGDAAADAQSVRRVNWPKPPIPPDATSFRKRTTKWLRTLWALVNPAAR